MELDLHHQPVLNVFNKVDAVNDADQRGAIGFAAGANAPADGYTITMATFELSTMHWLGISKLTYQNFTPLVQLNADAAAIILPKDNEKDLVEVPEEVRNVLNINLVETIDEVLSLALEDAVPTAAATDEAPPLWTTEQPSQGIQTR